MKTPLSSFRFRSFLFASALMTATVAASGCGGGIYAPCERNLDCAGEGLQCVNLNGEGGVCTRPCQISPDRSGYPDVLDDDALFENGAAQTASAPDSPCNDGAASATVQDGNVIVEGDSAIGVCRVSPELAASNLGDDSLVTGWCAPY